MYITEELDKALQSSVKNKNIQLRRMEEARGKVRIKINEVKSNELEVFFFIWN